MNDVESKIILLEQKFESVTLHLEKLEIKRDELIELDKDTYFVDNKIFDLECKQYDIQTKIEELEKSVTVLELKQCS